jgi:hypothetical protein
MLSACLPNVDCWKKKERRHLDDFGGEIADDGEVSIVVAADTAKPPLPSGTEAICVRCKKQIWHCSGPIVELGWRSQNGMDLGRNSSICAV